MTPSPSTSAEALAKELGLKIPVSEVDPSVLPKVSFTRASAVRPRNNVRIKIRTFFA